MGERERRKIKGERKRERKRNETGETGETGGKQNWRKTKDLPSVINTAARPHPEDPVAFELASTPLLPPELDSNNANAAIAPAVTFVAPIPDSGSSSRTRKPQPSTRSINACFAAFVALTSCPHGTNSSLVAVHFSAHVNGSWSQAYSRLTFGVSHSQ